MAARKAKAKIPKTKTFTGCWTCRRRSVKCDAVRPTCQRCGKAGLACDGYGIKLYWVTDDELVAPSAIKRQARSLEDYAQWSFNLEQVDQFLEEVDNHATQPASTPFGVFQVQQSRQELPEESEDVASKSTPCSDPSSVDDELPWEPDTLQLHSAWPTEVSTTGDQHWQDWHEHMPLEIRPAAAYHNALAGYLLDNYIDNVTNLLQPIPHPKNTYSSMYVPSAVMGSSKVYSVMKAHDTDLEATFSSVAIFYSVLATSAFHLRNTDSNGQFDGIAREFRFQAFNYLRKGIEELPLYPATNGDDLNVLISNRYQGAMAAMLTLVTADVMDGRMSEYWIHLDGVDQIRRQWQQEAKSNKRQITISSFLKVLSCTTSIDLPLLQWASSEDNLTPFSQDEFPDSHGLEHTYGITSTLAGFMSRITTFSQHISYFVSQNITIPNSFIAACSDLSASLLAWSLEDEELPSLQYTDPAIQQIGGLHITAFAQALRVHFFTRVLPCGTSELAQHVQSVADSLNCIERIKADLCFRNATETCNKMTASLTWPGFIASCEAEPENRNPWYDWWQSMLNYRIGNIARLWEIVQESWTLRDSGVQEVPAWVPVLRRTGQRILAV